jgi:hypothetical protein
VAKNGNVEVKKMKLVPLALLLLLGCAKAPQSIPEKKEVQKGGSFDFTRMNLTEHPRFIELQVLGTIAFLGDSCESITNGRCKRKLERLFPTDGFYAHCSLSPCYNFIRGEVGGKGKVWGKEDEILSLLGPIDTEEEAKLWIYVNGFDVINDDSLTVLRSPNQFLIRAARTKGCPLVKCLYQLKLKSTGRIEEVSYTVLETYNGCN